MWEPTAEIQAAAAAPSRAIGCGGDRRGKRSAAPVREGTDTERRDGTERAGARGCGGTRTERGRRSGAAGRGAGGAAGSALIGGEGPDRASPAAGREEPSPLPPSRLKPGSPRAWLRSRPPRAGGGGGAASPLPIRRRGGGRRGRCGPRSAAASLGPRVPR